jgi:hypothetical protein
MAGTLSADYIQPQSNTGLTILTPAGGTIASINTAGIYSATGNLLISSSFNGLVANTGISGLITDSQIASVANTKITGTITVANTNITGTITNNVNATLVTANTLNFYNGSSQIYAAGLGSGNQTWQNVTSSRVSGTTYTNSTGYPIVVSAFDIATVNISGYGSVTGTVNGVTLSFMKVDHATATDNNGTCVLIVPPGATYSVTWSGAYGTTYWYELR